MIRFAWLQFRVQAAVALAALTVLAIVLAITGIHLTHLFDSSGLNATCLAATGARNSCRVGPFLDRTMSYFDFAHALNIAVPAVAGLLGAFWGAPLVAGELSAGTHRLAWTQSVTRTRWFLSKLAVTGVATVVAVGVLTLMVTIWAHPIDEVNLNRLTPGVFPARGIVPIGYAMFAFALGVSTGVLIRRSVPAIAITLVIFAALQFAIPAWLRPHLISPARTAPALTAGSFSYLGATPTRRVEVAASPSVIPGAWIISPDQHCFDASSCKIITPSGHSAAGLRATACELSPPPRRSTPTSPGDSSASATTNPLPLPSRQSRACDAYISNLRLRQVVTYQPASRYWAFQVIETAVYVVLAFVLCGFCLLWVRSRLT
jgi:ABC-type transport system involved in multi-copper enzyme maturation permease subunit